MDQYGSPVPAARAAYILFPSDALFPPEDLRLGQQLLVDCNMLVLENDVLYPTEQLRELLSLGEDECALQLFTAAVLFAASARVDPLLVLPAEAHQVATELVVDADQREELLLQLQRRFDASGREALGARGEVAVIALAEGELTEAGLDDLAAAVRRVSRLSDDLGYDVVAPRIGGKRRLEVKTSASADDVFRCFVSRNEADWGRADADWALVACRVSKTGEIEVVGWCRASTLEPYLPTDSENGRWVSAELHLPISLFLPGLPPLV